jgi:hypothetical protein
MARRVELWDDDLVIPPALAARAAVLAFGNELVDLKLPNDRETQCSRRRTPIATAAIRASRGGTSGGGL